MDGLGYKNKGQQQRRPAASEGYPAAPARSAQALTGNSEKGTVTEPFVGLGFARYESHEGERPLAIRWRLHRAIPAAFVPQLALAI